MMRVGVVGLQRLREISCAENKLCRHPEYLACISTNEQQYQRINPDNVEFSKITVVLGKDGGISSEIVDNVSQKLQELNINTYVSDINRMTPSVSEQAILKNSSSTILIIKVDGHSLRNIDSSIIVGCETTKYDSLGLAMASSIDIDKTTIEKGKMVSGINIPTELENMFSKQKFDNMVSVVTILPGADAEPAELASSITDGIVRFALFTNVERERQYYDFQEKHKNWKYFSNSKTATVTNPTIYPTVCYGEIVKANIKSV